jgi:hypothetical protein
MLILRTCEERSVTSRLTRVNTVTPNLIFGKVEREREGGGGGRGGRKKERKKNRVEL